MHAFQKNWPRGLISKFEPLASNQRMAEVSTGCLPGGRGEAKRSQSYKLHFELVRSKAIPASHNAVGLRALNYQPATFQGSLNMLHHVLIPAVLDL